MRELLSFASSPLELSFAAARERRPDKFRFGEDPRRSPRTTTLAAHYCPGDAEATKFSRDASSARLVEAMGSRRTRSAPERTLILARRTLGRTAAGRAAASAPGTRHVATPIGSNSSSSTQIRPVVFLPATTKARVKCASAACSTRRRLRDPDTGTLAPCWHSAPTQRCDSLLYCLAIHRAACA